MSILTAKVALVSIGDIQFEGLMTENNIISIGNKNFCDDKPEYCYRDALQKFLKGKKEVICDVGLCDVVTNAYAIEVKHASDLKTAIGQALCYADCLNLKPCVAFFGKPNITILKCGLQLGIKFLDVSKLYTSEAKTENKLSSFLCLKQITGYKEWISEKDYDNNLDILIEDISNNQSYAYQYCRENIDSLTIKFLNTNDDYMLLFLFKLGFDNSFENPDIHTVIKSGYFEYLEQKAKEKTKKPFSCLVESILVKLM